jgi:hypothetical protein
MYGMLAASVGVFIPIALLSLALDLARWALVGAPPS